MRALGREHPGHGRRRGPSLETIAGISGTLQQSAAVIGGVLVPAPAATGPTTQPPQDPDATASPADTTVPSPLDPTAPPDGTDPASTTPPLPATAP